MGYSKQETTKRNRTTKGGGKLQSAVDEIVGVQCIRIATALVNKTVEGNMVGAKLLVEMTGASHPKEQQKRKRRGPSVAQFLANDKPWEGPLDDEEDLDPPLPEPVAS
jgi:hypothetical protein